MLQCMHLAVRNESMHKKYEMKKHHDELQYNVLGYDSYMRNVESNEAILVFLHVIDVYSVLDSHKYSSNICNQSAEHALF